MKLGPAGTALERTKCIAAQRHRTGQWLCVALLALANAANAESRPWTETVVRAPVAHGAQRVMIDVTVLRDDQAKYLSVSKDGPYKPDSYRY